MTIEHEPTGEPGGELSGPERDWQGLRDSRDQWKAKYEAAEPMAHRGLLYEAGYDPASPEGKVLLHDLAAGEVEPDPEKVAVRAFEEHGWKPNLHMYSGQEAVQIAGAQRLAALDAASTSEQYVDPTQAAIAEAREQGDFMLASALERRAARRKGS